MSSNTTYFYNSVFARMWALILLLRFDFFFHQRLSVDNAIQETTDRIFAKILPEIHPWIR